MARTYRPRTRGKLIEQANRNALTHLLLNKALTIEDKCNLVNERNPYLHIFGETLTLKRYEENYADWVNRLYIGDTQLRTNDGYDTREV